MQTRVSMSEIAFDVRFTVLDHIRELQGKPPLSEEEKAAIRKKIYSDPAPQTSIYKLIKHFLKEDEKAEEKTKKLRKTILTKNHDEEKEDYFYPSF